MESPDYFYVKCLVESDERAFEALYRKYHSKIYSAALAMTQSEALAQDVVQDVFLKVWENRTSFDPNKTFTSYIRAICRNVIFNLYKKATHEMAVKQHLRQFAAISDPEQDDQSVFEIYENLLNKAIAKLSPQRRIVFEYCKLQEKSYEDVAHDLNISCSTVQDHIVKANKFIREYMLSHRNTLFVLLLAIKNLFS